MVVLGARVAAGEDGQGRFWRRDGAVDWRPWSMGRVSSLCRRIKERKGRGEESKDGIQV